MEQEQALVLAEKLVETIKKFRPKEKLVEELAKVIKAFVDKPQERKLTIDDLRDRLELSPHIKVMKGKPNVQGEPESNR